MSYRFKIYCDHGLWIPSRMAGYQGSITMDQALSGMCLFNRIVNLSAALSIVFLSDSNSDFGSSSVHNSIEQTHEFYSIGDGSLISQEEHMS